MKELSARIDLCLSGTELIFERSFSRKRERISNLRVSWARGPRNVPGRRALRGKNFQDSLGMLSRNAPRHQRNRSLECPSPTQEQILFLMQRA